jgi:hypothetical protein
LPFDLPDAQVAGGIIVERGRGVGLAVEEKLLSGAAADVTRGDEILPCDGRTQETSELSQPLPSAADQASVGCARIAIGLGIEDDRVGGQ